MPPIIQGLCECGDLKLEIKKDPLFVHACHCLDCKRKTGSSFGITCIVLAADIRILCGTLCEIKTSPRTIAHMCSSCNSEIYKVSTAFKGTALLQTRCVADLRQLKIGAHIWVKRMDHWLQLPENIPRFEEGYNRDADIEVLDLKVSSHSSGAICLAQES